MISDYPNEKEEDDQPGETKIGEVDIELILRGRVLNEGESLFDVMDSVDEELCECYETVFGGEDGKDWGELVEDLYENIGIFGTDLLYIRRIELDLKSRRKEIAATGIKEFIESLGGSCGLVVAKAFPLQYRGLEGEKLWQREFEKQRFSDFAKVAKFWRSLGFRRLGDSDFYSYCPGLKEQPKDTERASNRAQREPGSHGRYIRRKHNIKR